MNDVWRLPWLIRAIKLCGDKCWTLVLYVDVWTAKVDREPRRRPERGEITKLWFCRWRRVRNILWSCALLISRPSAKCSFITVFLLFFLNESRASYMCVVFMSHLVGGSVKHFCTSFVTPSDLSCLCYFQYFFVSMWHFAAKWPKNVKKICNKKSKNLWNGQD